jgi:hypothetical protein
MDLTALLLSRLQFAFTVSFHIIFPSFTIGLAAWLTVLEALHLWTGRPAYRQVFEFWLKIFGAGEAGFRSAARPAGRREPAEPLRDHAATALRQPNRLRQPYGGRGRARQHPAGELATGADPILQLPNHGRLLVRHGVGRLGRIVFDL